MTVTFIGDSLTAGKLGIPYLKSVTLPPETAIVNRGRDGDTVAGVRARLDEVLRTDTASVLVIQVGANDTLLPEMARRGGEWTPFIAQMTAAGSIPTPNPDEFEALYEELLAAAEAWGTPRVIGVTVPPLGENLNSERNRHRGQLNMRIRRAVEGYGVHLADAAAAFEDELKGVEPPSDYFFQSPREFTADLRRLRRERGAEKLTEERGLHLTMDGAHLNECGAALMARTISAAVTL